MGAAGGRSGTTGMGALQFVDQLVDRRSCIVQCGHREITDRVGDHDAAYSTAASSTSESRTGLPRMLLERGAFSATSAYCADSRPPPPRAARQAGRPSAQPIHRVLDGGLVAPDQQPGGLGVAAQPGRVPLAQRPHVRLDHRREQRGAYGRAVPRPSRRRPRAPRPTRATEDRRPKTEEDLQLGARACQAVHDGRPDRDRD
jgi:hypothetical protein